MSYVILAGRVRFQCSRTSRVREGGAAASSVAILADFPAKSGGFESSFRLVCDTYLQYSGVILDASSKEGRQVK